jgi:hypothetical protein
MQTVGYFLPFKANQECYPHRHGWLCEQCDVGYVAFGDNCVECGSTNVGYVALCLIVLLLLVGILMLFSGRATSGFPKIFMYFLQIISLVVNPMQSWLLNFVDIFSSGVTTTANICITPMDYYGKIGIKVEFLLLGLTVQLLLPFLSIVYIALFYLCHALYLKIRQRKLPQFQRYIGGILYVLIFFYMSIASTCLSYLRCHTVAGVSVNFNEPSVLCDSNQYKSFSVLIYFVFLSYIVLFPIGTFAFLFWGWKTKKLIDPRFSKNYGALYKTYKPNYFWWEDMVLARRMVIVTVFVFISDNILRKQVIHSV